MIIYILKMAIHIKIKCEKSNKIIKENMQSKGKLSNF